jgi:RNA 3'-terminal phosphate cyclase (ATP)
MRQHLTAVRAAARVSNARVDGADIGSTALTFHPGPVVPGEYHFAIGTAGSATLVAQTVLPALLTASGPSRLELEGGTHNPFAPPFDFLERVFLPVVRRMGPHVSASIARYGFFPAGGGSITLEIAPAPLAPIEIIERGEIVHRRATVLLSALPRHIAERELEVALRLTGWGREESEIREVDSPGPGNAVLLEVASGSAAELVTSLGEVGLRAEAVAERAVKELRRYLAADVPVGEHLADQLLLPLALAGGGSFVTLPLSRHATTQLELIPRFLDVRFAVEDLGEKRVSVRVSRT